MDLSELIAFVIFGFIGLLFLLWGFWTWRTYKKKKKGLLIFQLIVFFGMLFWLTWSIRIFPGSQAYSDRQYNEQLTGQAFWTDLTYFHESPRAFNGDGYSIWVYHFDQETAELFTPPQNNFYSDYPITPDYRSHWQQKKWDKTPLKANDTEKAKKLKETFNYIEKLMLIQGCFYAYNYYMHNNDRVGDIDFYILYPTDKKLVIINHNT